MAVSMTSQSQSDVPRRHKLLSTRRCISLFLRRWLGTLIPSVVEPIRGSHPAGHFYSPIVDPDQLRGASLWKNVPEPCGIDFNERSHRALLAVSLPVALRGFNYPHEPPEPADRGAYYTGNSQFGWLDSRILFALLRIWKPRRILEVGSGYSTLLMDDVNRRFLESKCSIVCIEPYPRDFLLCLPGIQLVQSPVQDVPLITFESLEAGDVLFIDSSHVSKTGSDVNWIVFEVLPRLRKGVRIHFHDIFLPAEYPREWVLDENRSWNEQYLLRALLMYSSAFRVVFGATYAWARFPRLMQATLGEQPGQSHGGGSFWLERQ